MRARSGLPKSEAVELINEKCPQRNAGYEVTYMPQAAVPRNLPVSLCHVGAQTSVKSQETDHGPV